MKRLFFLLGTFSLLVAVMTIIGSLVRQEALLIALARQLHALSVACYAFVASAAYWVIEGQVYGNWKLEIYIDGKRIPSEEEDLEVDDAKGIFKYSGGAWWAFIRGNAPKLRRNRKLEELLRECFETIGTINVDPRDNVIIEGRCILLRLFESQITRKKP